MWCVPPSDSRSASTIRQSTASSAPRTKSSSRSATSPSSRWRRSARRRSRSDSAKRNPSAGCSPEALQCRCPALHQVAPPAPNPMPNRPMRTRIDVLQLRSTRASTCRRPRRCWPRRGSSGATSSVSTRSLSKRSKRRVKWLQVTARL